ncbi:hypothetical protein FF011L_33910 [Roseimaritima multifibrata]|uniref:DNA-binding protein VF530 n=1 Tax=Roseimaritima multifibrata TaxID=1930274 RepID=A0A517MIA0_9BACT|nr:VF530 family protein [Roseimaritima multifibrata]QDS94612.1 hypothetical protein FF011L_33910 [Roseimaritima multifibrata]
MNQSQPNNPLHGITLKSILEYLVAEYGWERLGDRIHIQCFISNPSINSSLKFLRKTEWARKKVERLYLYSVSYDDRHGKNSPDLDEIEVESETGSEMESDIGAEMDSEIQPGSPWDRARQK